MPQARYVELPGDDHVIWGHDSDRLVDEIQAFLAGALPAAGERVLLTVLAVEPGDLPGTIISDEFRIAEGREIRRTANRIMAVFQRPTRAIQCASAIRAQASGLPTRAAVHTGECERRGDQFAGIAIELTARLLDQARSGEIIASRTVRDLVAGSGLEFDQRGEVDLAGVPGSWQYFSVALEPREGR
jgi:class 3 adenylate cyclase